MNATHVRDRNHPVTMADLEFEIKQLRSEMACLSTDMKTETRRQVDKLEMQVFNWVMRTLIVLLALATVVAIKT